MYNQIWKRVEKLLKIEFDSETVYCDNDKYIKAKIKIYSNSMVRSFQSKKKNAKRKSTMQVFINNNARFRYQSKKSIILKHFWENANMKRKR